MTLQEQIQAYKKSFLEKAPKEMVAVMHRATRELAESDQMKRVVKVGDRAPDFALTNTTGGTVRLTDLLARHPIVLTFYRGKW